MSNWPTRDHAHDILCAWTKNKNLRKHAYAVEAAMRAYAQHFNEDPDRWGVVGLLHDFDYERYPDLADHPMKGADYLRDQGFPDDLIDGVLAHADHTGVPRDTLMKKAVYAVDELTGLIVAVALVRPSKKIADVDVPAVMRKWKDKAFAAGVNREDIERGAADLNVPLEDHVALVLAAMQRIAPTLGL